MAEASGLGQPAIRGCMLVLSQSDRAIVRPLDATHETWEVSHDFLVPLLDSIVARWTASVFWRRARPLLPWLAALTLVGTLGLSSDHLPSGPQFGRLDRDPTVFSVEHGSDGQAYETCAKDAKCMGVHAIPQSSAGLEPTLSLATAWGKGSDQIQKIQKAGRIVFQVVGSTGNVRSPKDMNLVTGALESDFLEGDRVQSPAPSFLLNLGDVIYSFGERQYYFDQFYSPWRNYPSPIFAVAGNHDGMVLPGSNTPTLTAFLDNFCASGQPFHRTPEAGSSIRTAQIQPGVYFTLEAPYIRILVLYSNTLEGPGEISSARGKFPELSDAQLQFLETALTRVKKEKFAGAVIIAVHHDPYSAMRLASSDMLADMDAISEKVGVWPHAVLSGHAHNYQRYTRTRETMQIPYIDAGNGGHGVARLGRESTPVVPYHVPIRGDQVVLENFDDRGYGYLRIIVDSKDLRIEYHGLSQSSGHLGGEADIPGNVATLSDTVTIDLQTGRLVTQ